jgi:hypothetical protein
MIIDSIVVYDSRFCIRDNVIEIPLKSLESGSSSVISIDKKNGTVHIAKGLHGKLAYNSVIDEMKNADSKNSIRNETIDL